MPNEYIYPLDANDLCLGPIIKILSDAHKTEVQSWYTDSIISEVQAGSDMLNEYGVPLWKGLPAEPDKTLNVVLRDVPTEVETSQAHIDAKGAKDSIQFEIEDDDEESTTSAEPNYVNRITRTQIEMAAGDYVVEWSYEFSRETKARIEIDNTTEIHISQPGDDDGDGSWKPISGKKKVTLTKGDHTFDLDYCCTGCPTAHIRRIYITFRRTD